jgi:hypothetical protein
VNRRDAKSAKMKNMIEPEKSVDELAPAVIGAAAGKIYWSI